VLFPTARYYQSTSCYRVTSKDLGRALQEDLILGPYGILDAGLEKGVTPIDCVKDFGSERTPQGAALWLCRQLGLAPQALGHPGVAASSGRDSAPKSEGMPPKGNGQDRAPSWQKSKSGAPEEIVPERVFDPWERFIVPPFPFEILPGSVQSFVSQQSE